VSAAQNIQLLRWCEEVGINVAWTLLGGFPGEAEEEYPKQAAIIPLLVHLQPPASCGRFRLDRFSPHFTRPQSLGIHRIRPMPAYFYVYPLPRRGLMRLAYYFDFDHVDGREPDSYIGVAGSAVQAWWQTRGDPAVPPPVLDASESDEGSIDISDTRPCRTAPAHTLDGLASRIYSLCDNARTVQGLERATGAPADEIGSVLAGLVDRKLTLPIDGHYLSLAVMRRRATRAVAPPVSHEWIPITPAPASKPLPASV
jgi:hypothetical protein